MSNVDFERHPMPRSSMARIRERLANMPSSFAIDHPPAANDAGVRLQVGKITPGWYLVAVTHERLKRDRTYVTALAYVPCPMNPWTGEPMERTRHPIIEINGTEVPPEEIWEAWTRIAHFPIPREDFMRRRGLV